MSAPIAPRLLGILAIAALLPRYGWAAAINRTDEASEASIKDGSVECSPYDYPPTSSKLSLFPGIWKNAKILPNDSVALDLWNSISGKIPNISQKSTSLSGYSANDPDCWWTYSQCTQPKLAGLQPDIIAPPEPSTLGYGFDDGPACDHNVFYDFLAGNNQKATMFFIGSNVMSYPLEAQRALTDGHEICLHTWSHPHMTTLASEDAFAEIYYCESMQAVKLAVGVTPTCWRPPYGDIDDRIRSISKAMGLQTFMWGYDTSDADVGEGSSVTPADVEQQYQAFINKAQSGAFNKTGAIVLTHELNNFTMSEAVKHYPELKAAFAHIVPIGVGLNITQPYVETNYSLPTFQEYISGTTIANPATVNATVSVSTSSSVTILLPSSSSSVSGNPVNVNKATSFLGTSLCLGALTSHVLFLCLTELL
ncbi:glycoside hydrolase/deacetylase [Dendrothele bispora CBS 962.96]|uniref:chitin deacetylase n=1 Tax=Dendrothele bispora (strain CBS 962.96) TaxID=1314807 RepID=A0A4S8MAV2_DENBC|nr:glycoside hydrolase/deacetylase [Dendrothele bispora CBS 962.96]